MYLSTRGHADVWSMLLLRVMLLLVIRAAKESSLMSVVSDAIGGSGDVCDLC